MKKLRALFIPTSNSGVTFWRMYNFWVSAQRQGIADFHVLWWQKKLNEMHPWEREIHDLNYTWRITKEMQDWIVRSDIVVFGTLHGPGMRFTDEDNGDYINKSMSLFNAVKDAFPTKTILTESDDNVISTPDYNPAGALYAPQSELRELSLAQFKASDGLIVSTPYLGEVYSEFNENYHVIPNSIDFKAWSNLPKPSKTGIRIGWAGGANHEDDLKLLKEVIPAITSMHKDVKFVFIHGLPAELREMPGVEFREKWTDIDKYPKMLAAQDFDIGMAPLVDNAFNRSKSNLRWLEYSALGIPTVASKVGHFKETINDSVDGLLAETPKDFITNLDFLIRNKHERKRIGANALERVRRDFNVDTITQKYVDVLKKEIEKHAEKMVPEMVN